MRPKRRAETRVHVAGPLDCQFPYSRTEFGVAVFYCASGTWETPFRGPPFDVGWRVEQMGLVRNQPVDTPPRGCCTGDLDVRPTSDPSIHRTLPGVARSVAAIEGERPRFGTGGAATTVPAERRMNTCDPANTVLAIT
jgi:hypothetical protein